MKRDISLVVEELLDEQEEQRRITADPDDVPVLQVHNLDVSYGPLQVLFGVDLEVKRGEVLALLGTNGAGKSTLLRAVSGLVLPDRGVVRMNGHTITLTDPEIRVAMGMVQVPGGDALFPNQTVAENLEVWSWLVEDPVKRRERMEVVLETFPVVKERLKARAGSMSGGEQQMLALSKAVMLDPEILLVDELSLGLAPLVVQQLLEVVERMKANGLTMVIVEQSVNVALAVADRAVFMERGHVRFEGPAPGPPRAGRPPASGVPLRRGRTDGSLWPSRSPSRSCSTAWWSGWCTGSWPSASCWCSARRASSTSRRANSERSAPRSWPCST